MEEKHHFTSTRGSGTWVHQAELGLASSLARTIDSNQYLKQAEYFKEPAATKIPNTKSLASKEPPRWKYSSHWSPGESPVDSPNGLTKLAWQPFGHDRLLERSKNKSRGSNIAQVLSEVRAMDGNFGKQERPSSRADSSSVPLTFSSKRIKNLLESRQSRHEAMMQNYSLERKRIEKELQERVGSLCADFRNRVKEGDEYLKVQTEAMSDASLTHMLETEIDQVKSNIEEEMTNRTVSMDNLGKDLANVEELRTSIITDMMSSLCHDLNEIAHVLPNELHTMLQQEVKEVNIYAIRNRSSYKELLARLNIQKLQTTQEIEHLWQQRKLRWRTVRHEKALMEFSEKMAQPEITHPVERRELFDKLVASLVSFDEACSAIVKDLVAFVPPHINSNQVLELTESLQQLYLSSDKTTDGAVVDLRALEHQMHQSDLEALKDLRGHLYEVGALPQNEIDAQIEERANSLVQKRHKSVGQLIQNVETSLDAEMSRYIRNIDCFSKFYKDIAEMWEIYVHQVLEAKEDAEEKLNVRGDKYDDDLAAAERHLQEEVNLLSQEPSWSKLDSKMEVVKNLVGQDGVIEELHRSYNSDVVSMTSAFPGVLHSLIRSHVDGLSAKFGMQEISRYHQAIEDEKAQRKKEEQLQAEQDQGSNTKKVKGKSNTPRDKPTKASKSEVTRREKEAKRQAEREAQGLESRTVLVGDAKYVVIQDKTAVSSAIAFGTEEDKKALDKKEEQEIEKEFELTLKRRGLWEFAEMKKEEELLAKQDAEEIAAGSKKKKDKKEKKSKKKGADAEEEKRREEAEAKQAEEKSQQIIAIREEIIASRNSIPCDTDGKPCFQPIKFGLGVVVENLVAMRFDFIHQAEEFGNEHFIHAQSTTARNLESFSIELDLKLRKHRPRFAGIQTQVFDVRKCQLDQNQQRFERHELRVVSMIRDVEKTFAGIYSNTEKSYIQKFKKFIGEAEEKVERAASMGAVQRYNTAVKQQQIQLANACREAIDSLSRLLLDAEKQLEVAQLQYVESCITFDDNSNQARYHSEEKDRYVSCIDQLSSAAEQVFQNQKRRIEELVTKLNSVQKLEKFSATYTNSVQELSVVQGLGHKFGAPKRKLTARLREEFARSMEQHSEIEKLLQSLLHMAKKVLDQKQGGLQASSDENSGKLSLTAAIITALGELRWRLLQRGMYLECMKEDRASSISLTPVDPTPILDVASSTPETEELVSPRKSAKKTEISKKSPSAGKLKGAPKGAKSGRKITEESNEGIDVLKGLETFNASIKRADESCRQDMMHLYAEYDSQNPDRKKTHTQRLQGGTDSGATTPKRKPTTKKNEGSKLLPPKIAEHCESEHYRATTRREEHISLFRKQVQNAQDITVVLSCAVFEDVIGRSELSLKLATTEKSRQIELLLQTLEKEGQKIRSRLKPSLEQLAGQVLDGLKADEESRVAKVKECISKLGSSIFHLERTHADIFLKRISHASSALVSIFDNVVHPADLLTPPEAEISDRKSLKQIVRESNRLANARSETAQLLKESEKGSKTDKAAALAKVAQAEGQRFTTGTWPGIRLDLLSQAFEEPKESLSAQDAKEVTQKEKQPSQKKGKKEKRKGSAKGVKGHVVEEPEVQEQFGPEVSGFRLPGNRSVIHNRDTSFRSYMANAQQRSTEFKSKLKNISAQLETSCMIWKRSLSNFGES